MAIMLLSGMIYSCRTTEANYRAAYTKALSGRDDAVPADSTIYGRFRKESSERYYVHNGDTAEIKSYRVVVTSSEKVPREKLKRYSVVAGQFKQIFNARSLRDRLIEKGYTNTFIINNAEPYYYIITESNDTLAPVMDALVKLRKDAPVALKEPLPYILHRANL